MLRRAEAAIILRALWEKRLREGIQEHQHNPCVEILYVLAWIVNGNDKITKTEKAGAQIPQQTQDMKIFLEVKALGLFVLEEKLLMKAVLYHLKEAERKYPKKKK